jgi:predicted DCC family thiol-disulfide oxidoreductase YuxK
MEEQAGCGKAGEGAVWLPRSVRPEPPFFIFDGDCGFCRKWATWLRRRLPADTAFVPYQQIEDLGAYGLTSTDVQTASYWIESGAAPRRGARSFAHALRKATFPWNAVGAILRVPVVRAAADRAYAVIARNRHRLPAPGSRRS